MIERIARNASLVVVALATALVILGGSIAPFLSPAWVGFEQGRADAIGWTGYTPAQLATATDAILGDLVFGPPDFDVAIDATPVLTAAERSHMRDVRAVFATGYLLVAVAAVALVLIGFARRRRTVGFWRAVRAGAVGLVGVIGVAAVLVGVAFDQVFTVFHELFFAAGTWSFDPTHDRIVQLFPDAFWFESTLAVGAATIVLGLAVGWFAHSRARRVAVETSGSVDGEAERQRANPPVAEATR